MSKITNQKGQSLVEYLIIVTLVAVATIGMVKAVGTNINVHFANIAKALGGDHNDLKPVKVQANQLETRDLSNYMRGASGGASK